MKIYVDTNEAAAHPFIVSALKDGGKNEIEIKHLECGDYFCPPVLIETKTNLADYVGSVKDGRIFKQAQDMLYTRSQNMDTKIYILISGNLDDLWKLGHTLPADPLIAAWASLNVQGIPTSFVGGHYFLIKGMLNLFNKYNDGKIRTYNPIRAPITSEDSVLTNYMSIEGIGEESAKKLRERFPRPKQLYNANLIEFEAAIGFQHGRKLYNFINGIK